MKKNKIKISLFSVVLALLSAAFVLHNSFDKVGDANIKDLPISYLHADFLVDTEEPREVVGAADYYFVAKVDEVVDTTYRDPVTIETEDGYKEVADPYTNYKVTIIENIKGKLQNDVSIDIVKAGGVAQDGKSVILFENDALLEVGEIYIITAFAQPDGSLLIAGPNSSELLMTNRNSDQVYQDDLKQYKQYFEEQVEIPRERFHSKYDQ